MDIIVKNTNNSQLFFRKYNTFIIIKGKRKGKEGKIFFFYRERKI